MSKKNDFDKPNELLKPKSEKEKEWLDQEVKIEFYNLEEPGLMNKFPYGTTRDYKVYTLMHGGTYTLPRKVIQHLESRQTPIWKYQPDGLGSMVKKLSGWKPRFQCRQLFA